MHRDAIVAIVVIATSLEAPQKLNNMWNRHGQGTHVASMQVRSIYKLVDSRSFGTTLVGRSMDQMRLGNIVLLLGLGIQTGVSLVLSTRYQGTTPRASQKYLALNSYSSFGSMMWRLCHYPVNTLK